MTGDDQHELRRQQFWMDVWTACTRSDNCTKSSAPTAWADEALAQFDARFERPKRHNIAFWRVGRE